LGWFMVLCAAGVIPSAFANDFESAAYCGTRSNPTSAEVSVAGLGNLWRAVCAVAHYLRAFVACREFNGDPDLWTPETGESPIALDGSPVSWNAAVCSMRRKNPVV